MNKQKAFSLVELSIVLVILGLLVGGVLAGQSLIRAAELRAVTTEQSRFTTAFSAFKDKYFALPGDFNTTGFGTTGWIAYGNGNGLIESNATAANNESSLIWIHLATAGLVEGSYTNAGSAAHVMGTTFPRSKVANSGWNVLNVGTIATTPTTTYFEGNYGNAFLFGSGTTLGTPGAVLKPEEAWNIDTKMDDGRPATGSVLTLEANAAAAAAAAGCSAPVAAATTLAASVYSLDVSGTNCSFIMKTGY